jgi:excisionase family DNA binding protein
MSDVLNSWKEIATYLNAGVRTVQRWERMNGLPVHRAGDGVRAHVLALKPEIDAWIRVRNGSVKTLSSPPLGDEITRTRELLEQTALVIAQNASARRDLIQTRNEFRMLRHTLAESVRAVRANRKPPVQAAV